MKKIPIHWRFKLWSKAYDASELFDDVNVLGAHCSTDRRLLRIGPWGFHVIRYRPGNVTKE